MVDIDRMVGWLMELVKDTHLTSRLRSGSKDGIAEIILCHHLRTTECEEYSARLDALESLDIKACIALQSIV